MRICCLIRTLPHYRRDGFIAGIRALGAELAERPPRVLAAEDVLIIWNRYGDNEQHAKRYEAAGGTVIVAENGYIGHSASGDKLFALARGQHNGAGWFPAGEEPRWKQQHITLHPPRAGGKEIVVLPSRGIGPHGVAMPQGWTQDILRQIPAMTTLPVRVRPHPGQKLAEPLERDLRNAAAVVTWASGAAIKALALGIPVFYFLPNWIAGVAGHYGCTRLCAIPPVDEAARDYAMHRIGWAQWSIEEIATGIPLRNLLRHYGKQT